MPRSKFPKLNIYEMQFELGLPNAISKCTDAYLLNRPHEIAREKKSVSEDRRRNDIKRLLRVQDLNLQLNAINEEKVRRWDTEQARIRSQKFILMLQAWVKALTRHPRA